MKVILIPQLECFPGSGNVHYGALLNKYELTVAG